MLILDEQRSPEREAKDHVKYSEQHARRCICLVWSAVLEHTNRILSHWNIVNWNRDVYGTQLCYNTVSGIAKVIGHARVHEAADMDV